MAVSWRLPWAPTAISASPGAKATRLEENMSNQPFGYQDPRQAFHQGVQQGHQQAAQVYEHRLRQAVADVRDQFEAKLNRTAGGLRKEARDSIDRYAEDIDRKLREMDRVAGSLTATRSGGLGDDAASGGTPGTIRVENLPGRRIPYIYLVEIPIESADMSIREQSFTVSQDGPFVATRRWCTFLSQHQFQVTDPQTGDKATFPGRSYGRWRAPHSADDIMDGGVGFSSAMQWYLSVLGFGFGSSGPNMPGAGLTLPSSHSPFRSMQFDGRVHMENAGSGFPRQNKYVPTSWYADGNNGPVELPALDFMERGEVVTWKVQPSHPNNPGFGNVTGACVFPNAATKAYPFLDGQFDPHEGINTPDPVTFNDGEVVGFETIGSDPVVRLPDGVLFLALEGYRIIQPPAYTL
jgi:hypothetical protein